MTELEALANGLSEAQREAVLHGHCGVPRTSDEWTADCICSADPAAQQLYDRGLAYRRERYPGGIVLSEPGLALRAHLLAQSPAASLRAIAGTSQEQEG